MERTIYSKYSNERAERFRIRTDIVTDEAGEKKVYKYACTIQAGDHIRRQEELGKQLDAAYAGSRITFCPCTTEDVPGGCRSVSPFVQGDNLQHLMEQAERSLLTGRRSLRRYSGRESSRREYPAPQSAMWI